MLCLVKKRVYYRKLYMPCQLYVWLLFLINVGYPFVYFFWFNKRLSRCLVVDMNCDGVVAGHHLELHQHFELPFRSLHRRTHFFAYCIPLRLVCSVPVPSLAVQSCLDDWFGIPVLFTRKRMVYPLHRPFLLASLFHLQDWYRKQDKEQTLTKSEMPSVTSISFSYSKITRW